jgi:predicted nucleic acid-binding protein
MDKAYIETTLFNFYFAEKGKQYFGKTVQYCRETKKFFEAVRAGKFEPYTSDYVLAEIERESDEEHRLEMLKLIADCNVIILPGNEEIERLARLYIEAGAIPETFPDDALHIAATAIYGLNFIVSLNFQHIVKDKTIQITARINEAEGYTANGIYEPGEVIDDEGT